MKQMRPHTYMIQGPKMKKIRDMKKIFYIVLSLMLLSGCVKFQFEEPLPPGTEGLKVPVTMTVSIPNDGPSTKAMADDPQIKNIMVAVFGGSGYFNEWVRVTDMTEMATLNYDGTSATVYEIKFSLTASDSRLRLHFIANCPSDLVDNPPITGVSSQDLEDAVMARSFRDWATCTMSTRPMMTVFRISLISRMAIGRRCFFRMVSRW